MLSYIHVQLFLLYQVTFSRKVLLCGLPIFGATVKPADKSQYLNTWPYFPPFSDLLLPAGIYLIKVNNRNTRTRWKICSKLAKRHQNDANGVVKMSLLLTLNIFHILFQCFYCELWTCNFRLGCLWYWMKKWVPGELAGANE